MAGRRKSKKELLAERQLRVISGIFERLGIVVRREKLASGPSFRVKSGNCLFGGKPVVFVDRRLPAEQQQSVLADYLVELGAEITTEEMQLLPDSLRTLVKRRMSLAPA